jgi:hypothetical protein
MKLDETQIAKFSGLEKRLEETKLNFSKELTSNFAIMLKYSYFPYNIILNKFIIESSYHHRSKVILIKQNVFRLNNYLLKLNILNLQKRIINCAP